MTILSDYAEQKIINHVLRNTAWTSPGANVWVAAHTADPTDAGGGAEVPLSNNYGRVQVTTWDDPTTTRATQNTNVITFPTASGSWGTVSHIGVWDAQTGGNLLFYGALSVSKTIGVNDIFTIAAGDLDFSLGGAYSNYLAKKIIDHMLRNTAYTTPGTSVYVALYSSSPTAADSGAEIQTPGTYAYARKQITTWDAPTATGATQNTNLEAFTAANGGNWGTVAHVGIRDASTLGNLLFWGALDASKVVNDADTFQFAAGALDITVA